MLPSVGRVAFRADASNLLGFGHVARMFAIVEAVEAAGGEPVIMFGGDRAEVGAWARDRGRELPAHDWTHDEVMRTVRDAGIRTVVIDGQDLTRELVPRLAQRPVRVVMIDDLGIAHLPVGVVVNHNYHATALKYPHAKRALLGRRYLMLRRDIRRYTRGSCRPVAGGRPRVIVTFGGSDPTGATARVLRVLPGALALELVVIAGPGFIGYGALDEAIAAATAAGHTVDLRRSPDDPGALFVSADAAICSAGGTLGELAYLGCPALAFATVNDQITSARHQAEAGLIGGGGIFDELSDDALAAELVAFFSDHRARTGYRQKALATADGDGARRIVEEALAG